MDSDIVFGTITMPITTSDLTDVLNIPNMTGMIGRGLGKPPYYTPGIRHDRRYGTPCIVWPLPSPSTFTICDKMRGRVIAAGGSVLGFIEANSPFRYMNNNMSNSNSFLSSDLDLYIRANTPKECSDVLKELLTELNPIDLVQRSQFALTLTTSSRRCLYQNTHIIEEADTTIKVQIIEKLLPYTASIQDDIKTLFDSYDLDCCKWATDGRNIYNTARSVNAFKTRICHIPWDKITDSSVSRMAKYYQRCYDFEIEGYNKEIVEFPDAVSKIIEICTTSVNQEPLSYYDKNTLSVKIEGHQNVMFCMYRTYMQNGVLPHMICGSPSDLSYIINVGKQPMETYFSDWMMDTMNKMCEKLLWMSLEDERSTMQDICIRALENWKDIMQNTMNFGPMFQTCSIKASLSQSCLEKYWTPKNAETTFRFLVCYFTCGKP